MRQSIAAAAALAALAACSEGGGSFHNRWRQASIDECVRASRSVAPPHMVGLDWPRVCACATDGLMAGKSMEELTLIESDTPEQRAALEQCVTRIHGAAALSPPPATPPVEGADGNKLAQ